MAEQNDSKFKVKIPKLNASRKTYDFSLSLPGMISAVGVGVVALTFFFVMGILIGRGYRPEADVPQLSEIMPTKEHGQVGEDQPIPEVLKAEELEYPERLKDEPHKVMDDPTTEATEGAHKLDAQPTPQPEKQAEAAKPVEATPVAVEASPAASGEPVFDYVYQVASFKQLEMAQALATKLDASGLKTNIQAGEAKGTTWHRVQVLYHGTPASTETMKAALAKHGINKPLLVTKKAAQ